MTLKEDLKKAIREGLQKVYPLHEDESFGETTEVLLEKVWGTLEDVVGTAQEQLFQQLTAVRTELSASRRREEALMETIRNLQPEDRPSEE